jgi:hypothetical protein
VTDVQSDAGSPTVVPAEGERSRLRQDPRWSFPGARGLRDLWRGWRDYRELWLAVGWYDIRKRYRRSLLGPFWITVSLAAFIAALTFLYVPLVGGDVHGYLSFVAFGFIAWQFMSQLVVEGCNVFIANGPIIQQFRAPLRVYIYESVWKNLIILAHNFSIYVFIVVLFGLWPSWATLLVVPGIIGHCRDVARNSLRTVPRYPADCGDRHADDVPADTDLVAPGPSARTRNARRAASTEPPSRAPSNRPALPRAR